MRSIFLFLGLVISALTFGQISPTLYPSTPAVVYQGSTAPPVTATNALWLSTRQQDMRPRMGQSERVPIFGTTTAGGTSTQECNMWFNSTLNEYESIANGLGSASETQGYAYAPTPYGPWTVLPNVFGNGYGGESSAVQQATIYQEGSTLYLIFRPGGGTQAIEEASFPMPTSHVAPTFTILNTSLVASVGSGSCFVTKNPITSIYELYTESKVKIYTTSTPVASWTNSSFTLVNSGVDLGVNLGARYTGGMGRPQVIFENGQRVMYCHLVTSVTGPGSWGYRFICTDPLTGVPTNWTPDGMQPFIRMSTVNELDQIADVRAIQGPNNCWFIVWTATNNRSGQFQIEVTQLMPSLMVSDGQSWYPAIAQPDMNNFSPGYQEADAYTNSATLGNHAKAWCNASGHSGVVLTFPAGAIHNTECVTNGASTGTNRVGLAPTSGDTISDGYTVTAASWSGTSVTLTIDNMPNLSTNDTVIASGCSTTGVNVSNVAITSITYPSGSSLGTITYTGTTSGTGSAPTTLPCIAFGVRPAECKSYTCWIVGSWVRDNGVALIPWQDLYTSLPDQDELHLGIKNNFAFAF